jgi:bifunctional DNA-binding transcriptional regulator/antitoxin component of YhaV-PrlF toxin-antitoxin module
MTKVSSGILKLGTKSQIVMKKDVRKALGIKPGSLLSSKVEGKRFVIEPFDVQKEMDRIEKIAHMIGKKIPKGINSVDIIRKERE